MKKPTNLLTGMPYTNAARSQEPNYLRERFAEIMREQREAAERAKQTQPVSIRKKQA